MSFRNKAVEKMMTFSWHSDDHICELTKLQQKKNMAGIHLNGKFLPQKKICQIQLKLNSA